MERLISDLSGFIARIQDPSQIAEARRNVRQLAVDLDFGEEAAEKAAIIVTEASTNLLKHGNGGHLVVRQASGCATGPHHRYVHRECPVLEMVALDRGPGIANVAACLEDGHSTSGTSGTGLGAIGRLSSYTEIYSRPGRGTVLLARVCGQAGIILQPEKTGVVQVPKSGEDVCGDQWGEAVTNGQRTLLLADGLGHGIDAARASSAAVDVLHKHSEYSVTELLGAVHDALRPTRGAAVAIARLNVERQNVAFAGLGNISATLFGVATPPRRMVSTNGTAGVEARHLREFTYPWCPGDTLILHSDGIGTHWNLSDYPGLGAHDPAIIAGVVFRDFNRGTDDATVIVAK